MTDKARQKAQEAEASARPEAERITARAQAGDEGLRQSGVIYGGADRGLGTHGVELHRSALA
jgi:hypothetical protein